MLNGDIGAYNLTFTVIYRVTASTVTVASAEW